MSSTDKLTLSTSHRILFVFRTEQYEIPSKQILDIKNLVFKMHQKAFPLSKIEMLGAAPLHLVSGDGGVAESHCGTPLSLLLKRRIPGFSLSRIDG